MAVTDDIDLMEELDHMYSFFEEISAFSVIIPDREYATGKDIEDIRNWIAEAITWVLESDMEYGDGSRLIKHLRTAQERPDDLLEWLRMYRVFSENINCREMMKTIRTVYTQIWPGKEIPVWDWPWKRDLMILNRKAEEERSSGKEAETMPVS